MSYPSSDWGTCTIQRVTGLKKLATRRPSLHALSYVLSKYRLVLIRMQSNQPDSELVRYGHPHISQEMQACLFILRSVNRHRFALGYQGLLKRRL